MSCHKVPWPQYREPASSQTTYFLFTAENLPDAASSLATRENWRCVDSCRTEYLLWNTVISSRGELPQKAGLDWRASAWNIAANCRNRGLTVGPQIRQTELAGVGKRSRVVVRTSALAPSTLRPSRERNFGRSLYLGDEPPARKALVDLQEDPGHLTGGDTAGVSGSVVCVKQTFCVRRDNNTNTYGSGWDFLAPRCHPEHRK